MLIKKGPPVLSKCAPVTGHKWIKTCINDSILWGLYFESLCLVEDRKQKNPHSLMFFPKHAWREALSCHAYEKKGSVYSTILKTATVISSGAEESSCMLLAASRHLYGLCLHNVYMGFYCSFRHTSHEKLNTLHRYTWCIVNSWEACPGSVFEA